MWFKVGHQALHLRASQLHGQCSLQGSVRALCLAGPQLQSCGNSLSSCRRVARTPVSWFTKTQSLSAQRVVDPKAGRCAVRIVMPQLDQRGGHSAPLESFSESCCRQHDPSLMLTFLGQPRNQLLIIPFCVP